MSQKLLRVNIETLHPPAVGGADAYLLEDGSGIYLAENGDRLILE